jgi:exopolysaccharide biosynthesis polyprenyl glycosylphosphotransferase
VSPDHLTHPLDTTPILSAVTAQRTAAHPRPRIVRWELLTLVVDLVAVCVAGALALVLAPKLGFERPPVGWVVALPVIVLLVFRLRGSYASRLRPALLDDLRLVLGATAIAAMAVTSLRVATTNESYIAAQEIWQWILTAGIVSVSRVGLFAWEHRLRRMGRISRPTLIIGAGTVGHLVARRLLENPELGLRPVGFLDKEPLPGNGELPVLGASWDLERVIEDHGIEQVIVTFSTAPHQVMLRIARTCEELRVGVALVPRLFENFTARLTVEHLGGLPLVSIRRSDPKGWQFALKYACDRLFAALGLVLCAPVLLAASAGVLLTMGRPIFYSQRRIGRDGRRFTIVKLRSMRPASHEDESDDERLTRFGAFLRRTSIDELPQLINVLKGEMSLIGPRPERPELVAVFEQEVHRYEDRHRVKSGITGWAQVHGIGRGEDRFGHTTLSDRVEWDNYYIENWSPWLDVKIVLLTMMAVLRFRQG